MAAYVRTFNAVEGNTTFMPAPATVTLGGDDAGGLPFLPLPRDISHEGDRREQVQATHAFLELLAPLGARVAPL